MKLKDLLRETVILDATISKSPHSLVALYNNTDFMLAIKSLNKDIQYFEIALENFKKTKEFHKLSRTEQKDSIAYGTSIVESLSDILKEVEQFNNIMET